MSRRQTTLVTLIATALGVSLLVWQVRTVGAAEIASEIRKIGVGGLALILGASFFRLLLRAKAWLLLLDEPVPLRAGLAAVMSGDAIGNLTPLSLVASEPAKALYVRAHVAPQRALAALAAENFFYSLSVAVTVIAGVLVMFVVFPGIPDLMRTTGLITLGIMAAVLVAALWLVWKEPALISGAMGKLPFVGTAYVKLVERVRELETSSYAVVRSQPARLAMVIACHAVFHALSFAETYITLSLLGFPGAYAFAFVLDTVQRVVNVAFRIVPLKAGVDEAASGWTTELLGYGLGLGVAMGVIRKIRVLIWAAVGLALGVRRARS
jgi:hypothetical protein